MEFTRNHFDILVLNENDKPLLGAAVIKNIAAGKIGYSYYHEAQEKAKQIGLKFLLIVSRNLIEVWDVSKKNMFCSLKTEKALKPYSRVNINNAESDYLKILVELWLEDLILPWKKEAPPYREELTQIGLVETIKNGQIEVGALV